MWFQTAHGYTNLLQQVRIVRALVEWISPKQNSGKVMKMGSVKIVLPSPLQSEHGIRSFVPWLPSQLMDSSWEVFT